MLNLLLIMQCINVTVLLMVLSRLQATRHLKCSVYTMQKINSNKNLFDEVENLFLFCLGFTLYN